MLSDRERQALDEVQRRFLTEDPRFAASFDQVALLPVVGVALVARVAS
jgi:Protein of unknown function (DUF3040)